MTIRIIILNIFLLSAFLLNAQVITVLDKDTNNPLEFVSLYSDSPKAISTTNSYGQTEIISFLGSKKITFQLLGYKTVSLSYKEIVDKHFVILLSTSHIALDQVIVSATKWKQRNREIPSRVSTISPKDIVLQNPQTAADLLNISGEVYIQKSQQGGGSPMIRGFAANRVLISIDGIRMNNAIFRSGNLQNVISIDPFSIENTELLFGPGSIIYGSDAIGGTMNFFTVTPKFSLNEKPIIKGNAQYRFSNANKENTGHFDINIGWRNFSALTNISYNTFDNLVMGSNGPNDYLRNQYVNKKDKIIFNTNPEEQIYTGYTQLNLMQKFRYSPNSHWYFDYGFYYSETSDYDRYDRLIRTKKNGSPKSSEWYYGPQIWMMNNINITNLTVNPLYDHFVIRVAHQLFKESRNDRDFLGEDLTMRKEKVNAFSLTLDFNKNIDQKCKLSYGIEGIYNNVNSIGSIKNIHTGSIKKAASRYPESDWFSLAGYFVYQRHINSELFMQTGLRYNLFNIQSEFDTTFYPFSFTSTNLTNSALTGSLGFVYTPIKSWVFGVNLSTSFRAPNVDDIGKIFDSEPGYVVVPNPNLDSEYAYNAEFNIAKVFNKLLKIDFSVYYTYLDNALVRRAFKFNGLSNIYYDGELSKVQAIQNAAYAYIYGFQTGFVFDICKNIYISANINYQKGEEEVEDGTTSPLRHAAPFFGKTQLTYNEDNLQLKLDLVYNSKISNSDLAETEKAKKYLYAKDKNGNPYSPSWYTLNFNMSYKILNNLLITSGIQNITDQRYRPYSSGIAAAGRNFVISTKYSF